MKKITIIFLLFVTSLCFAAAPSDRSANGLASWVESVAFISSGTGALPAVGPIGARYTDLTLPAAPIDYRSNGSSWVAISGTGGDGTSDHSALSNLGYAAAGHYDFPSLASLAAIIAQIPLNASFTYAGLFGNPEEITVGSGTPDASMSHAGTGTLALASYVVLLPDLATPTAPATGTHWYDGNTNKEKVFDGTNWNNLW